MNINVLGIDLAKNVFQVHGIDSHGNVILKKKLSRNKFAEFITNLPSCLIGMESCSSSNFWARKFRAMGHTVKLISPQFVKPYMKTNKNDETDAEAICEAVTRPNMRFVSIKTIEQQDIQAIHRIRSRLVKERTALINQIRGLLMEYGMVINQGISHVRKNLAAIIDEPEQDLSDIAKVLFNDLLCELRNLDEKVKIYDTKIESLCKSNETSKKLLDIEGIGPLTATAIIASVGDASVFKNGREMSAFIGMVPRQHSSGGKSRLLGISKRGDSYLRCLLIHGARAAIYRTKSLPEKKAAWLNGLIERRGKNRAAVALANKNIRVIWAIMTKGTQYSSTHCSIAA